MDARFLRPDIPWLQTHVGRAYGRVGRRLLRTYLLNLCKDGGVAFHEGEVTDIDCAKGSKRCSIKLAGGEAIDGRHITLCAGAVAAKFLEFEERGLEVRCSNGTAACGPAALALSQPGAYSGTDAPLDLRLSAHQVAAQTAYGIEAEVEGYEGAYDPREMLFMDYRRHHTGVWFGTGTSIRKGAHPNAGEGMWDADSEPPSFLYAMPLKDGKVFLEETCLVAKPALPFGTLKRRLERRLSTLGIRVVKVHDREWSYIPVGGSLPRRDQALTAFGATANMVHPATGYSLTRSMQESERVADVMAQLLLGRDDLTIGEVSARVWNSLWTLDRRKAAAFQVFGMELLAGLNLPLMNDFFNTFFALPRWLWTGFLSSKLSANQLLVFAMTVFFIAPASIKLQLVKHLLTSPSTR